MMSFNAVICGGTYNPVHEGHLWVVQKLLDEIHEIENGLIVIATTFHNPWKGDVQPADFELRLQMWEALLQDSGLPSSRFPKNGHIYISDFRYVYAADFIKWWRTNYSGSQTWVTSTDSAGLEKNWKDWSELEVSMKVLPMHKDVHSTAIRKGSHPPAPAIRRIISQNRLYPNSQWE